MNLDVQNIGLIDFSAEDDFLIDQDSDNTFDLRLSVAFETQMELVSHKPRARVGKDDMMQYLADKELEAYRMKRERDDNVRNSLAWDNAFFTSPGFLKLEELCLVNRGFKDPQRQSVCGHVGNVRRKVCLEIKSGHRAGVVSRHRQNTQSLARVKLASPTKMIPIQDLRHQKMTIRQIEAFPEATFKSEVMQSTTTRKEHMKLGKATAQNRFSTAHNKKSPLQGLEKNEKKRTPERSLISSSLPVLSTTATNTSIDLSPHIIEKSQGHIGECFSGYHMPICVDGGNTDAFYTSTLAGHQNYHQSQQPCIQQFISGTKLQRQNATRGTKSPLSANSELSPTPSRLRLPSEKMDYFDMRSEMPIVNGSSLLAPKDHINSDEKPVTNVSTPAHTPANEPKKRLNDVEPKRTPPILQERKAHNTRTKAAISQENLEISSHYEDGNKPSEKGQRRRNHANIMKRTNALGREEKENMFISEDTVIELEPKNRSPLPHQLGSYGSSVTTQPSDSLRKPNLLGQKPTRQANFSPIGTRKPFSTKNCPLQKSSIF